MSVLCISGNTDIQCDKVIKIPGIFTQIQSLEVVDRGSETQFQETENVNLMAQVF